MLPTNCTRELVLRLISALIVAAGPGQLVIPAGAAPRRRRPHPPAMPPADGPSSREFMAVIG